MSDALYYKVMVTYEVDGWFGADEALDNALDALAHEAGDVIDSGAGSGMGMRDMDWSFATRREAEHLVTAIRAKYPTEQEPLNLHVSFQAYDDEDDVIEDESE